MILEAILAIQSYANNTVIKATTQSQMQVVQQKDFRAYEINDFLEDYSSPISGRAGEIVEISEGYGVDPLFLTSLSVIESSACRNAFRGNCFGFGGYSFADPIDGFRHVAEALSGEGKDGGYYRKCLGVGLGYEKEVCILKIYNPNGGNEYINKVIKQKAFIKSY